MTFWERNAPVFKWIEKNRIWNGNLLIFQTTPNSPPMKIPAYKYAEWDDNDPFKKAFNEAPETQKYLTDKANSLIDFLTDENKEKLLSKVSPYKPNLSTDYEQIPTIKETVKTISVSSKAIDALIYALIAGGTIAWWVFAVEKIWSLAGKGIEFLDTHQGWVMWWIMIIFWLLGMYGISKLPSGDGAKPVDLDEYPTKSKWWNTNIINIQINTGGEDVEVRSNQRRIDS